MYCITNLLPYLKPFLFYIFGQNATFFSIQLNSQRMKSKTRRLSTNKQNIEHRNTCYWGTASCSSLISDITSFRTITFSDELNVAYTSSFFPIITIFLGVKSYELLFLINRTKDSTFPRFRTICTLCLKNLQATTEKPHHHSRNKEK